MVADKRRLVDDLTDEEIETRSLMMRMYRSRINGDVCYPARLVVTLADDLLEMGWIEAHGQGYRLTPVGVRAWAMMCKPLLRAKSMANRAQFNELLWVAGLPFVRAHLMPNSIKILEALADAGGVLPLEEVEQMARARRTEKFEVEGLGALIKAVYAVSDGTTVKLTGVGRVVVTERNLWVVVKTPSPPAPLPQGERGEKETT